jgi:hypothetical protein
MQDNRKPIGSPDAIDEVIELLRAQRDAIDNMIGRLLKERRARGVPKPRPPKEAS